MIFLPLIEHIPNQENNINKNFSRICLSQGNLDGAAKKEETHHFIAYNLYVFFKQNKCERQIAIYMCVNIILYMCMYMIALMHFLKQRARENKTDSGRSSPF